MDPGSSGSAFSANTSTGVRKYTPGGHKLISHGIIFHEQYLLLCACKSFASDKTFRMTCEFKEAGKFDDLVYFHRIDDTNVCEMIQYKHMVSSKVLELNELVSSTKNTYSLVEYFNSYLTLYYSVTSDDSVRFLPFEINYECTINSCILLTNRDIDADFARENLEECTEETQLFCSGTSYRFKATGRDRTRICTDLEKLTPNVKKFRLKPSLVRSKVNDFLDKFILSVKNESEVEKKIKEEIKLCMEKQIMKDMKTADNVDRVDNIYKYLSNRIFHFHSSSEVVEVTDNDCLQWFRDANEMMGKDLIPVYHEYNMNRLPDIGTNPFTRDSIKHFKDFLADDTKNQFCAVGRHCTIFALLKLIQVLKEVGKSFRVLLDVQFQFLYDKHVIDCDYLIVRCESRENWNEVLKKSTRVLVNNKGKKIAFVIGFEDSSAPNPICDETRWPDLAEDTRQSLGHKSISFQGTDVPFSALDVSRVEEQIEERVLDDVLHENLKISKRFDDEKSEEMAYFVDRTIGRRNRVDLELFRSARHEFIIQYMTESEYESFIAEKRFDRSRFRLGRESEFEAFCEKNRDKNISLLYHADGKFYWKKTRGESIEKSIGEDLDPKIDLNDVTRITDQTVLIVAEPGMGKSNLLSVLLERSVENRPDVWIVKINLDSHTARFYEMQEEQESFSTESAIEFVVESQRFETSFESDLFRSYFCLVGKLIVLCDGFDEIAPDYRDVVLGLIVCLRSIPTIRVWLTSRPQERNYLESGLALMSYSMLEFTVEDQKTFFMRFWTGGNDVADARAQNFIDRLLDIVDESFRNSEQLLTGIPLQCKMLGEVYRSRFEEFHRSGTDDPGLSKILDIVNLYEDFVRVIFKRCIAEKEKYDKTLPAHRKIIEYKKEEMNDSHKVLSLEIVFPQFKARNATDLKKYKARIVNGEERTGIVHSLDGNNRPVFIHKTFAEYFSALWFRDILNESERETNEDLFVFLEENIFKPQYEVFRKFFDRISIKTDPALKHGHNNDLDSLKHVLNNDLYGLEREFQRDPDMKIESRVDVFQRNALHMAASYGYDDMIGFLIDKGVRTDCRDRLFEWTPLRYCLSSGFKYSSIESLLPGNENDASMFGRITTKDNVLEEASYYGYGNLVAYLLKHGPKIDVENWLKRLPLHFAVQKGRETIVEQLLAHNADVNVRDNNDKTPLHRACKKGYESIVAQLLAHKADVNVKDGKHKTPLHLACRRGYESIVKQLLAHEADVNAEDNRRKTPLHVACRRGYEPIAAQLLAHEANVNAANDKNITPLHFACRIGHESLVARLLAHKAEVYVEDNEHETPLDFACKEGHETIVATLLAHKADVNAKDERHQTPLNLACKKRKRVDSLATVSAQGRRKCGGQTPPDAAGPRVQKKETSR